MSIIEQAAKRLEQLRHAGIEVPHHEPAPLAPSTVSEVMRREALRQPDEQAVEPRPGTAVKAEQGVTGQPVRRSQTVDIDLVRLAAQGYITPEADRSQLADEFRVIKRPLLNNVLGKSAAPIERANLIMVTSALPGEGKTFTAINLAMSLAMEVDCTVLLVDADFSRAAIPDRLGLKHGKGLMDLLTQRNTDLADVIVRTNVDKLSLLPAGKRQPRATELLASDGMGRLLEDLASRYSDRVLVFDGPPLLASTESRVLATHMGQVIVVVEADRTPQATVQQAMATIESCPVVMAMLNKVPRSEVGSYYGYYGAYAS